MGEEMEVFWVWMVQYWWFLQSFNLHTLDQ